MSANNSQVVQPKIIILPRERRRERERGDDSIAKVCPSPSGVRRTPTSSEIWFGCPDRWSHTSIKRVWKSLLSHNEASLGERGRLLKLCLKVAWEPARVGFTAVPGGAGFRALVDWGAPTGTKGRTKWAVGSAGLGLEQTGSWVVVSESCLQGTIRNGVQRCITLSHWCHRWRGEDLSGVAWIL